MLSTQAASWLFAMIDHETMALNRTYALATDAYVNAQGSEVNHLIQPTRTAKTLMVIAQEARAWLVEQLRDTGIFPTVYLAARYTRREELLGYRAELQGMGFVVIGRWLDGNHQISDEGLSEQATHTERVRFAQEDWDDLMRAELVISFTEEPRATNSRGGRHVEFGAALASGKSCLVIGPRENVFHCLPDKVAWFPSWDSTAAQQWLTEYVERRKMAYA